MASRSRHHLDLDLDLVCEKLCTTSEMIFLPLCIKIQTMQVIQNDVIKCCKMMSSNVVLLHSNNCCVVLEPAICEDLDLHVAIF